MPSQERQRIEWATDFPHLQIAFQTNEGRRILDRFYPAWIPNGLFLVGPDSAAASAALRDWASEQPENTGAAPWQAMDVLNGEFEVRFLSREEARHVNVRYLIFTPTRGQLAGKRVVKVESASGPGGYKAIGWVTPAGVFQVWSRFARYADSEKFVVARELVEAIRGRGRRDLAINPDFSVSFARDEWVNCRIRSFNIRCVVCNATVSESEPDREVTDRVCANHWPAWVPADHELWRGPRPDPEIERQQAATRGRIRRRPPARRAGAAPVYDSHTGVRRTEPVIVIGDFPTQRYNDLMMCELGSEEVR